MSKGFDLDAQLRIAIGDYWDIAQAEAHEQRDTDDEAGSAQAKWSEIDGLIRQLAEQRSELLAALQGVVRVADRATDEFDAARTAIANATQQRNATGGEG